jgi:hypothetical protein
MVAARHRRARPNRHQRASAVPGPVNLRYTEGERTMNRILKRFGSDGPSSLEAPA